MYNLTALPMWPLLLLLMALIEVEGECPSRRSKIKFSVISRRNVTGHEIVKVDLKTAESHSIRGREVTLDVEHESVVCQGEESVGLATIAVSSPPPLPNWDYEFFPGFGFYKRHVRGAPWEAARRMCEWEHAHLAIVNSAAEASLLRQLFARKAAITDAQWTSDAYIGMHEGPNRTEFVTIFGEPEKSTGYNVWRSNKNSTEGSTCGSIDTKGELVPQNCYTKLTFFCEVEV